MRKNLTLLRVSLRLCASVSLWQIFFSYEKLRRISREMMSRWISLVPS